MLRLIQIENRPDLGRYPSSCGCNSVVECQLPKLNVAGSSPVITAVAPDGIDAESLRKKVKDRFDILLAGGQDHLKGKVFRIGHLGFVCDRDVLTAVAAIEATLQELGLHKGTPGAGVAACAAALAS